VSSICSRGHQNPIGNRFCVYCGERLTPPAGEGSALLANRYRFLQELGQGGFGRTYLAEDLHRFQERCVLKEYVPQVEEGQALQKAQELFEREAGVLYKLDHPQIPRFRELFRTQYSDRDRLFLVQDYVEGPTYRQLLQARQSQGRYFSEAEVTQLLLQLLPVLDYIHRAGVVHRDIAPDNLIQRTADQQPVLIDFGGVKELAAKIAAAQHPYAIPDGTRIGKLGYAPPEQMEEGKVYAHSDLYALAATAVVLLTGREPQDWLITGRPVWHDWVTLSPTLKAVLTQMMANHPVDRYQSASAVLQALQSVAGAIAPLRPHSQALHTPPPASAQVSPLPQATQATVAVAGIAPLAPTTPATPVPAPPHPPARPPQGLARRGLGCLKWAIALLILIPLSAWGGWWLARTFLLPEAGREVDNQQSLDQSSQLPAAEQQRKAELQERRESLGVDYGFLVRLTNDTFYATYPEQQGRTLTAEPADQEWRSRWDMLALDWLDLLETQLSAGARARLGTYTSADQEQWKAQINPLYVGSRALNDLTDARFFFLFPDQRDQSFIDQPIGQVWRALAWDQVLALEAGENLEEIRLEPGSFRAEFTRTLASGEGRVHIAYLSEGQILRLNLQDTPRAALLSVYLPRPTPQTPALLEDSHDKTWSGRLPQSGYYEIVVVTSTQPLTYRLTVAIDNVRQEQLQPQTAEQARPIQK
jgi:serine/threonine-protein kinase